MRSSRISDCPQSLSQELEKVGLLGMNKLEPLSLEEVILLLLVGIDLGTASSDRFGNLRYLVVFHFHKIQKEVLDLETTQDLLSSPSL